MRKTRQPGFTLVELLVAITIAVVLAGAVYATLSAGLKSREKGNTIAQNDQIARSILDQIQHDLLTASVSSSSSISSTSWVFTATASTMGNGSTYTDSLQFVATDQGIDWTATPMSDEAFITYGIGTVQSVTTPNTNLVGLVRTVNRHITTPGSSDTTSQLVSQSVVSLHFQYYDGTQWTPDWTETGTLPQAVQITVGIQDAQTPNLVDWYTDEIRLPKA